MNGIYQCYDLEQYTGKVSNIPSNLTSVSDVTNFLNGSYAKGAAKLAGFNGSYGNIASFTDSGTVDSGKRLFKANSQYIIGSDSRVRILLLDGTDFASGWQSYADNTAPSIPGSYSGNNGIKVGFTGSLDYQNGQWLQMRLCQETSNDDGDPSYVCKSIADPTDFAVTASQPELINITSPTSTTPVGSSPDLTGSNYAFDSSGNLYRTYSGTVNGDCTIATQGYANSEGALFTLTWT